jgi:Pilus biogenesis CpaD protein (pilus_cpaD)
MNVMKSNLRLAAVPLMLGLAACAAEYSKSEAPDTLRVDGAESRLSIAFAGGSDRLSTGEAARLDRMVVAGAIRPADRVEIAASGPPGLAERRAAAISRELLRYGIVTQTVALGAVPANHALVSVGRYTVTLPSCPNWSQSLDYDFTNAYTAITAAPMRPISV